MAIYLTHLGSGVSLCRLSLRDSLLCVPTADQHSLVARRCKIDALEHIKHSLIWRKDWTWRDAFV
jgi:hypothetical protein